MYSLTELCTPTFPHRVNAGRDKIDLLNPCVTVNAWNTSYDILFPHRSHSRLSLMPNSAAQIAADEVGWSF